MQKKTIVALVALGIIVGGCANSASQGQGVSASSSKSTPSKQRSVTKTSAKASPVGKVISTEKMDWAISE